MDLTTRHMWIHLGDCLLNQHIFNSHNIKMMHMGIALEKGHLLDLDIDNMKVDCFNHLEPSHLGSLENVALLKDKLNPLGNFPRTKGKRKV